MKKRSIIIYSVTFLLIYSHILFPPIKAAVAEEPPSQTDVQRNITADFFDKQMEWIGTTPGERYGEITKFVTIRWKSKEDAKALEYLPKDKEGQYVDWVAAVKEEAIRPKGSLDPDEKDEEPLDLNILMETRVQHRANVLFPHWIHTYWLKCENCHPDIFIAKTNANPISMMKIINGEYCGRCHGKVAFPIIRCYKCHSSPKPATPEGPS
ncbi:MAG: c(7)-type cytochrome triheme domain-containing protein [Thermodesulfobacteriota bacterium]